MSRLLMCGWETADTQQIGTESFTWNDPYTQSYQPRSGNYDLVCGTGDDVGGWTGIVIPHATQTELYYAFGLYRDLWETHEIPLWFFSALDASGHVGIALGSSQDGKLIISRATAGGGRPSDYPTQWNDLSSYLAVLQMYKWHYFEVHIIASTGSTGTIEVKLDKNLIYSQTAVRTSQTNANLAAFRLEMYRPMQAVGDNGSEFYFDDLRVNTTAGTLNNSWCGDGSIRGLMPNGPGTTIGGTPLTPVGGGVNWQNVDDRPANSYDYNTGTAVGTGETYTLSDLATTISGCQAVNVIVSAFSPLTGGSIGITTRSGGSTSEGPTIALSASPLSYYNRLMETNPDTSAPWTQTAIDLLEAGITIR